MSDEQGNGNTFQEFQAYWQLAEHLIAAATKDEVAETARILALQAAHYARKYGPLELPDLQHLLTSMSTDHASIGLLRDSSEALVGVLGVVTSGGLSESDTMLQ